MVRLIDMKRKSFFVRGAVACVVLSLSMVPYAQAQMADEEEIELIQERLFETQMSTTADASVEAALLGLEPSGAWSDITYTDPEVNPELHLRRVATLARGYHTASGSYHQDPALRDAIFDTLRFWLDVDHEASTWWWNTIGYGRRMIWPLALMQEESTLR